MCLVMLFLDIDVGGAGGKGTWGKLVEVYDEGPARDSKDPNYDSEEEVRINRKKPYCCHVQQEYVVTPTLPEMSVDEFQQHGEEVIKVTIEILDVKQVGPTVLGYYFPTQGFYLTVHCYPGRETYGFIIERNVYQLLQ